GKSRRECPEKRRGAAPAPPPPLGGEGKGGGMQQDSLVRAHPLPNPPAEVGFIRLRPLNGDRTRVNPSSVASGGGSTPSAGSRVSPRQQRHAGSSARKRLGMTRGRMRAAPSIKPWRASQASNSGARP